MTQAHDELALAAAYVLGALDPGECRAFEAHMSSCSVCAEEVRSLTRVSNGLSRAVPQRTPSPALRARVLAAVGADREASALEAPGQQRRGLAREWLPLAAALVAAVAVSVYAWQLQHRVTILEARLEDAERRANAADRATVEARGAAGKAETALAVLSAPDLVRIDLTGRGSAPTARARALWSRTRGMVFTATDLPPVPAGRVYQVWVVTGKAPASAGLLTPDAAGRATVYFATPADIPPPLAVAVTVESAGGAPAPTGEPFLVGTPL